MTRRTRALQLDSGQLRFREDHVPIQRTGEVPVRVLSAGICETDLQLVRGYMDFQGVIGHEFVGIAESGTFAGQRVVGEINCYCSKCPTCIAGRANHCPNRSVIGILNHDGAFADIVYVPEKNLHAVPNDVPDHRAVFTEPLAAAFQIESQLNLENFGHAVVVGDGRLGYLIAQVLGRRCNVTVVGKHASKLSAFSKLGMTTIELEKGPLERKYDLAVDCSGSPSGLVTALQLLVPTGTLVLKTTTADVCNINLAPLVIDEIQLIGSRCGPFRPAIAALQSEEIEVDSLVTATFEIEQFSAAFQSAMDSSHQKVLFEINRVTN